MAANAEKQMNLAALQQRDPYIVSIVDTASQVALYCFNSQSNEWEKTSIEGTLFVYTRSASPINGFMILNRLGLNDLIEPINRNLEFQLQDPFLLYRNEKASIYGIWFYDKDECARIGQLMNSLVQVAEENRGSQDASGRQRRASESDTMVDRNGSQGALGVAGTATGGVMAAIGAATGTAPAAIHGHKGNVDILQMLSKALDEYDKTKPLPAGVQGFQDTEPKPLIDNPNAAATKSSDLIRPRALKVSHGQGTCTADTDQGAAAATGGLARGSGSSASPATGTNTLEKLFRQASIQHETAGTLPQPTSAGQQQPTGQMPTLLQRLMSNPSTTVEEIERHHRGEIPRDQMPKPVGEEAPPGVRNGNTNGFPPKVAVPDLSHHHKEEPDSPNTALKRSLNILPSQAATPGKPKPRLCHTQSPTAAASSGDPAFQPSVISATPMSSSVVLKPTGSASSVHVSAGLDSILKGCQESRPTLDQSQQPVKLKGKELMTPQAWMHTAVASLPDPMTYQDSSSRLPPPTNVLLSPMAFGALSGVSPPSCLSGQTVEKDKQPLMSLSPQDVSGEELMWQEEGRGAARASHSVTSSSARAECPTITPLTREQLQQSLMYLLKNDSQFLGSLHEAYVKSLNIASRGPSDRS